MILTNRLERLLRKELVERTAEATDGFYSLAFDRLSISFITGELRMEGISLTPDSVVFNDWASRDSLPPMYVNAYIGVIDFRGVNLVWRRSSSSLHFRTFEIKSPDIEVYSSNRSGRVEKTPSRNEDTKTLYELISPYLNVLTVETMNLENARVTYTILDDQSPMIYALDNVTFNAYGFHLDEHSLESGKLLYCDNIAFTTNKPQTLIVNNDFKLSTDSIFLDTSEQLIHIGNINLASQDSIWNEIGYRPDYTIDGNIESVEVKGVVFNRNDGLISLSAKSFDLNKPDIIATSISVEETPGSKAKPDNQNNWVEADSLIEAMSLYEVISPILNDVSIDRIGIDKARMKYLLTIRDTMDIYTLDRFNFEARGFVVDSASSLSGDSKYYKYISFDANQIDGLMRSGNQHIQIDRLAMDTEEERLHIENARIVPLQTSKQTNYLEGTIDTVSLEGVSYQRGINARLFSVRGIDMKFHETADSYYTLHTPTIALKGLGFQLDDKDYMFRAESFTMDSPEVGKVEIDKHEVRTLLRLGRTEVKDFAAGSNGYQVGYADVSIRHMQSTGGGRRFEQKEDATELIVKGFRADAGMKNVRMDDLNFSSKNLVIPIDNGFFTLKIGNIQMDKNDLVMDDLQYTSPYQMMDFAYHHPKNADWFDIRVGQVKLNDIDIPAFFEDNVLRVKHGTIDNMTLKNFRNQKLPLPRKIVPMIYEGLQKAPIKIDIPQLDVNNFAVEYYELAEDADVPGKLSITNVNGKVKGLTNIATQPQQFIQLDAEARFMGSGYFTVTWMLPVSPSHDQFLLHAHLKDFDLTDLNELIVPLAYAKVESGRTKDLIIDMDASSKGGTIRMAFPYRDLKAVLLKDKDDELAKRSFLSFLVNAIIKTDNPDHPDREGSELRVIETTIERDPYHSTFNYFWQMIRPALVESVGVSKGVQKFGGGVMKIITGIKNFFTGGGDKEEDTE